MSLFRDFRFAAAQHRAPATVVIVSAMTVCFVLIWMRAAESFTSELVFFSTSAWSKPWTFLSYPFYYQMGPVWGPAGYLFLAMWLWMVGGAVESDLGLKKFLAVWVIFVALCALGIWVGATVLGQPGSITQACAPVSALTVMWGTRNASAQVRFMFIIPVTGKWLAWISAGLMFFGTHPAALAPFAAAPLILAYMFAAGRLSFAPYGRSAARNRGENPAGTRKVYRQEYYDEVKRREQAREEKERLRRLFEKSMIDDPDDK